MEPQLCTCKRKIELCSIAMHMHSTATCTANRHKHSQRPLPHEFIARRHGGKWACQITRPKTRTQLHIELNKDARQAQLSRGTMQMYNVRINAHMYRDPCAVKQVLLRKHSTCMLEVKQILTQCLQQQAKILPLWLTSKQPPLHPIAGQTLSRPLSCSWKSPLHR